MGVWIDGEKLEDCPTCEKPLAQDEYDFQFCRECKMPKLNTLVEVGFCAGYGDGDYRVSTAVSNLSQNEMQELKATLIDAANCMVDMWRREKAKEQDQQAGNCG